MAKIIQYIDTPLIPGQAYQLTFNTDITNGVLIVKQGTQQIYQSASLEFGIVGTLYDTVHITERVILNRVSRIDINDYLVAYEALAIVTVANVVKYESITITESVIMLRVG